MACKLLPAAMSEATGILRQYRLTNLSIQHRSLCLIKILHLVRLLERPQDLRALLASAGKILMSLSLPRA